MRRIALAAALLALATAARAQERERIRGADLPPRVERRLIRLAADPGTRHMDGGGEIGAGDVVRGAILAMDGALVVAGDIEGDVAVLGGELRLEPGARIEGDVTLVDARLSGDAAAAIHGTLYAYDRGTAPADSDRDRGWPGRGWRDRGVDYQGRWGRADLGVDIAGFDRVQGLALALGPEVTTAGRNPLRLRATWILQTESSDAVDRLDYDAAMEQFIGGRRELRVGVGLQTVVSPIESTGLSDIENALATALSHRDYRDYFGREGWRAYAAWEPRAAPLQLAVTYRDEDHSALPAGDPWTLTDRGRGWRLQPLVAEGSLRSVSGGVLVDTRRHPGYRDHAPFDLALEPWRPRRDDGPGWYVRLGLTRGVGGTLALPAYSPGTSPADGTPPDVAPRPYAASFTSGLLDVRRYEAVGWNSVLALRGVLAGTPGSAPLAPQFQRALGGPGTLPGYGALEADCGARTAAVYAQPGDAKEYVPFYAGYGCDRVALFQAEYRGDLRFDVSDWFGGWGDGDWRSERAAPAGRIGDGWHDGWDGDFEIGWAVFFDAAQGWSLRSAGRPAVDTGALYDGGVGLLIGDLGIYWAKPLRDGSGSHFFLRLGKRF